MKVIENNIFLGDCLEFINKVGFVDYVVTSPPYNRKRNDKYKNYNDTLKNWYELNVNVIDKLLKITSEYIFYNIQPNYYNKPEFYKLIGNYHKDIVEIIVWEKSNPMPASGNSITNAVEYFLVLGKKSLKSKTTYTKNHFTTSVNSKMPKNHKAVMHQDACDFIFNKFLLKGKKVLDPFMGTGTTGISAHKYGLDFIGIELDKEYCEIANEKISKFKLGLN